MSQDNQRKTAINFYKCKQINKQQCLEKRRGSTTGGGRRPGCRAVCALLFTASRVPGTTSFIIRRGSDVKHSNKGLSIQITLEGLCGLNCGAQEGYKAATCLLEVPQVTSVGGTRDLESDLLKKKISHWEAKTIGARVSRSCIQTWRASCQGAYLTSWSCLLLSGNYTLTPR